MSFYQDKVAIVTGAASGIGKALALALDQAGARVVCTDVAEEALRAQQSRLSDRARIQLLDVTDSEAVTALVNEVAESNGRLDLMFNNAGVGLAGEVRDCTLDDWRRVINVNTFGVIHGVQACYPIMVSQGFGHIVNTASGAGLMPRPGMTPYATSKYAVVGLGVSLRPEAAGLGVRVSTVCPGYIQTAITQTTQYKGIDGQGLLAEVPLTPMSSDRCAKIVLRGVRRNRAIIPVSGLTWLEWWLNRLSPSLMSRIARYRATKFRAHRLPTTPPQS